MRGLISIDSFTGRASELRRGDRTVHKLLQALAVDPRISIFEMSTWWLSNLVRDAQKQGLIVRDIDEPYPWCRYDLTDKGREALEEAKP